jgi:hypothetical protein
MLRKIDWYLESKDEKERLYISIYTKTKEASLVMKDIWLNRAAKISKHFVKIHKIKKVEGKPLSGKIYLYEKDKLICKAYSVDSFVLYTLKSTWMGEDNTKCILVHYEPDNKVKIETTYTRLKSRIDEKVKGKKK